MPLQIAPTISPRERILGFGVGGTGKSAALLSIARKCPNDQFYIVDTDVGSYERLLATQFTDVAEIGNVHTESPEEWDEALETVQHIIRKMGRDDWLGFDMMTQTWDWVQEWFSDQVFGKDIADYFLEIRQAKQASKEKGGKDAKSLGALDGWKDWPVINKTYNKLYRAILRAPGHVYLAAEQTKTGEDDDKDTKELYGPYGVKPKGQKRLGHVPHTSIMFTKTRVGEYQLTTIKDRGRPEMERQPVEDFARDYLMKVAGWKPVRPGA